MYICMYTLMYTCMYTCMYIFHSPHQKPTTAGCRPQNQKETKKIKSNNKKSLIHFFLRRVSVISGD